MNPEKNGGGRPLGEGGSQKGTRNMRRKTIPDDIRGPLQAAVERVRAAEFANQPEQTRRAGLALADTVEKAIMDVLDRPIRAIR